MDCHAVRVELAAYALGALDSTETESVNRHVANCRVCAAECEAYGELIELMGTVRPGQVEEPDPPDAGSAP